MMFSPPGIVAVIPDLDSDDNNENNDDDSLDDLYLWDVNIVVVEEDAIQ